MFRLWSLIYYFTRPDRPQHANAPLWMDPDITRNNLISWLIERKHFLEDWRDTLRRYGGLRGKGYTEQRKAIDRLIEKALERKFLLRKHESGDHLTIDWRGMEFLLPQYALEATLREFSTLTVVVSSLIGGGLLLSAIQKFFF